MDVFIIRTIAAIVILAILVQQARQAAAGSKRRRAFALAAASIGVFLVINGLLALGVSLGPLMTPLITVALVLLAASLLFLFQAWRGGEMNQQVERMRQALAEERTRRESQEPTTSGERPPGDDKMTK